MAGSRYRQAIAGDELQFIVFRADALQLAVNIFQVVRILRYVPPEAWPGAPAFVEGGLMHAGHRMPLLDLRKRLGLPAEYHEETRIMVLDFEGQPLGLVVDQVHEALRVDTRTIAMPAPPTPGLAPDCLTGVISRGTRPILVLNPARLLTRDERRALAEVRT